MIPQRRRFVNRKFSIVEQNGNVPKQAHYFIFSRKGMTASQVLKEKRSRWGIENQLHWVLDMQFLEAESRAGAGNSAKHRNVIRHWAYDLLKSKTSVRGSSLNQRFKGLLNKSVLDKIVRSAFCS